MEMSLAVALPDKAKVTCNVNITEGAKVLSLELRTLSLFAFYESLSQEDISRMTPELASHAYSYAAHMTSALSREMAILSPICLPPFDAGSFELKDNKGSKPDGKAPGDTATDQN